MPFEKLLSMGIVIPTLLSPTDAARDNFFARQRCDARSSRFAPHSFGLSCLWPNTVRAQPLLGWPFSAGFFERFVPDLPERIAKKSEGEA